MQLCYRAYIWVQRGNHFLGARRRRSQQFRRPRGGYLHVFGGHDRSRLEEA